MDDFKAVLVGLVLIMARHGTESRGGQEREYRDNQDEQRKRSPVAHVAYTPSRPVVRHHPVRQPITQIEQDQELQQDNRQRLGNVAEDVVPHLVSEDKQRLRCGHVLHRGSHTTTRLVPPKPVTSAFNSVLFSLAFISNMRSGGMSIPPRWTTRSICATRSA